MAIGLIQPEEGGIYVHSSVTTIYPGEPAPTIYSGEPAPRILVERLDQHFTTAINIIGDHGATKPMS